MKHSDKLSIKFKKAKRGYVVNSNYSKPTLFTELAMPVSCFETYNIKDVIMHAFYKDVMFTGTTVSEVVSNYFSKFITDQSNTIDLHCYDWGDYEVILDMILNHQDLFNEINYRRSELFETFSILKNTFDRLVTTIELDDEFEIDNTFDTTSLNGDYTFWNSGKIGVKHFGNRSPWGIGFKYTTFDSGKIESITCTLSELKEHVVFHHDFTRPKPVLSDNAYTSEKIEAVLDFETVEVLSNHESYDCSNIVLISISDPDDRSSKHKVTSKFKKVLELSFTDATYFNEGQVKFQQLQYLKDFILENKDEKFMINCVAGSRRSAVIAAYLEVLLGLTKTLQTSKVWKMWRYEQNQLHIDRINKFMETEFVNEDVWKMHIETGATGVCESHWGHYLGHEHSEVKWTNSSLRLYRGSYMPLEVELNDLGGLFYLI